MLNAFPPWMNLQANFAPQIHQRAISILWTSTQIIMPRFRNPGERSRKARFGCMFYRRKEVKLLFFWQLSAENFSGFLNSFSRQIIKSLALLAMSAHDFFFLKILRHKLSCRDWLNPRQQFLMGSLLRQRHLLEKMSRSRIVFGVNIMLCTAVLMRFL